MTRGAALLALAFAAGALTSAALGEQSTPPSDKVYRALDVFAEVYGHVRREYYRPVDDAELVYGAIDGMVDRLDEHSEFMTPESYRRMREETQGRYGGIGVEIALKNGHLVVVAPIAGTPGERAGLRSGDVIAAIDDEPTKPLTVTDAVRKLRGEPGSRVRVRVERAGAEPRTVEIVRERIRIVSAEGKLLGDGYGYVRVRVFQYDTTDRLSAELARLRAEAKGDLRGLVIDLRNNPGGLLAESISVADLFLDSGEIVRTASKRPDGGHSPRRWTASRRGTGPREPLALLINQGSASAAEIVAGALQDHRRALLVGRTSFGKGTVQSLVDLSDGSGLKLTIAQYITPAGRMIDQTGLAPDVELALEAVDEDAAIGLAVDLLKAGRAP